MKQYLMALDQGTTSSRTVIFDREGRVVAKASREFTQYFPNAGWVEHDANEIFESQLKTARQALAMAELSPADIAALMIALERRD